MTALLYKIAGSILIVALLVGGSFWQGYSHGGAAMRAKYETLVAQYTAASAKAAQQAKDDQAEADAAAVAEQAKLAADAQAAASLAETKADTAQAQADKARKALETSHDPDVVHWRAVRQPDGAVRMLACSPGACTASADDRHQDAVHPNP